VSHETARRICWTGSRLTDAPELARKLVAGEITFDRAEQVARLPAEERAGHQGHDISGLRRLVAHHKRLTRRRERKLGNGSLNFGSDELVRSFWGELPGIDSRIVEKAVDQRADEIIPGDAKLGVAERRALPWPPSARTVSMTRSRTQKPLLPKWPSSSTPERRPPATVKPGSRCWPGPGSGPEPSKRSSVTGSSGWSGSPQMVNH